MCTTVQRFWCLIKILLLVAIISSNGYLADTTTNSADETSSSTPMRSFTSFSVSGTDFITTTIRNDASSTSDPYSTSKTIDDSTNSQTTPLMRQIITSNATTVALTPANITTVEPTTIPPTTPATPAPCGTIKSGFIDVKNRTSNMFTGIISYNCSFTNWEENVAISYNNTLANCSSSVLSSNSTENQQIVNVKCVDIQGHAGRNWTFTIHRKSNLANTSLNETLTVTLKPLPLRESTNISITVDSNLTSASVVIWDCKSISDPRYLVFRCNDSDTSNSTLPENCTYTCYDLEPGSNYTSSLVRLPIRIADKKDGENDTFLVDSLPESYKTNLDNVTNLNFIGDLDENRTAVITFTKPRGNYNEIRVDCDPQDQHCWTPNATLTSIINCFDCTSISIFKVVRGVNYSCQAVTKKEYFNDTASEKFKIKTALAPVFYDGPNSSNTSSIMFNVTRQSDFDYIVSLCTVIDNQTLPCTNRTILHDRCSTTSELNVTLGCDYNCSFTTVKQNYINVTSKDTSLTIYPPKPNIYLIGKGSRWINITWEIPEVSYIKSFDIFINDTRLETLNNANFSVNQRQFFRNFTENDGITPFKNYDFYVTLNSNHNESSKHINVATSQEAPKPPSAADVKNKILPQNGSEVSTDTQYVISIDLSLFSNDYGIVKEYFIYVRQNQTNNESEIVLNGTYIDAYKNASIDYLALIIPLEKQTMKSIVSATILNVTLGNETECLNDSVTYVPCNGPLKPKTVYRIIMVACTNAGCTNVLSEPFETKFFLPPVPPQKPSSILWVIVFPLVAIIIVISLVTVKRKSLKKLINRKFIKSSRPSTIPGKLKSKQLPSIYTVSSKRPKPLSRYVNMSNDDEKAIYAEYQELDGAAPLYRQSDYEPEYATYNRYANIPARGPWERTAVRLTGSHRVHDYINANEIKGIYSENQYIACQGPLQGTATDFWEMIIQYRALKIVMLTRTEEKNPHNPTQTLAKCFAYFPKNKGDSLSFDGVTVQVIDFEERSNADLEIRKLLIKDDNTEHRVYHYYFTGWPDFSVVDRQKLLDLIETVNTHGPNPEPKTLEEAKIPMVVHCSAGVGRTGTYIAVDILTRLINRSNNLLTMELDVMGIVYQLRLDRGKMVQTKDQYMLVNRCVEEHLRRINKLDEIIQQASAYENADDQHAYSTSYKKDTDSVVLRQSRYEHLSDSHYSEIKDNGTPPRPPKTSVKSQLHNS